MQIKFNIDVDCANCAAKMEEAAKKVPGVSDVAISFMSQKMIVEAEESDFDQIMPKILRACKKIEPDCEIYL